MLPNYFTVNNGWTNHVWQIHHSILLTGINSSIISELLSYHPRFQVYPGTSSHLGWQSSTRIGMEKGTWYPILIRYGPYNLQYFCNSEIAYPNLHPPSWTLTPRVGCIFKMGHETWLVIEHVWSVIGDSARPPITSLSCQRWNINFLRLLQQYNSVWHSILFYRDHSIAQESARFQLGPKKLDNSEACLEWGWRQCWALYGLSSMSEKKKMNHPRLLQQYDDNPYLYHSPSTTLTPMSGLVF